jgi:DNA-binding transcriptional LysR family regulator
MIDRLEMFVALARERHFGRAAEACGVTQPTLSSAIRALEDQLGVQLVWRGSRFQGLTPEGQRALEWARGIVADARAMREEMRAARSGLSGNLRLGVIPTALPMVADLIRPFSARHPGVRVAILSRTSAQILDGIELLDLDAGITYLDNEPLGRVARVPLYAEDYRLMLPRAHPMAGRDRATWAEAADCALCLLTADMQNRRIVDMHLAEAGRRAAPQVESNSMTVLVAHVRTGHWASIVPAKLVWLFRGDHDFVSIPLVAPEVRHQVGLIATPREPHTPVLEALLAEARAIAEIN